MSSLYEIQSDIEKLLNEAVENEGEISEEWESAYSALSLSRDAKLSNWYKYLRNQKASIDAIETEIERLEARREQAERAYKRSLDYLGRVLGDGNEWKSNGNAITWRTSESVEVEVPANQLANWFNERFLRIVPERIEADKVEIKKAIKAGEPVEGAKLVERRYIVLK